MKGRTELDVFLASSTMRNQERNECAKKGFKIAVAEAHSTKDVEHDKRTSGGV